MNPTITRSISPANSKLLAEQETNGAVLLAILLDNWGTDIFTWEPQLLRDEVYQTYATQLSDLAGDKLQATIAAITADDVYTDWVMFLTYAQQANNRQVDPDELGDLSPEEIAWAIVSLRLLDGNDPELPEFPSRFSPEVRRFIGVTLEEHGMVLLPPALKVADIRSVGADPTDVATYQAWQVGQQDMIDRVNQYVKINMGALASQMNAARLRNKDAESWDSASKKLIGAAG